MNFQSLPFYAAAGKRSILRIQLESLKNHQSFRFLITLTKTGDVPATVKRTVINPRYLSNSCNVNISIPCDDDHTWNGLIVWRRFERKKTFSTIALRRSFTCALLLRIFYEPKFSSFWRNPWNVKQFLRVWCRDYGGEMSCQTVSVVQWKIFW